MATEAVFTTSRRQGLTALLFTKILGEGGRATATAKALTSPITEGMGGGEGLASLINFRGGAATAVTATASSSTAADF